MQNKFKIIDDSADKTYFTIIPNYIVNHSTVYEQAIYLYMKRVAGENGTCWSSAQTIAKKLSDPDEKRKVSRNTVAKYRDKLVERGWIEFVGFKGKTKPTAEYRIVDLWKLNMDHYTKESSSGEQSTRDGKKKVQQVNLESATGGHKEEPIKNNPSLIPTEGKEKSNTIEKQIAEVIDHFKEVNPSYKNLFSRKPQRQAARRLIEQYGFDRAVKMVDFLKRTNGMKYAPAITTPCQLEEKMGMLKLFVEREMKGSDKVAIYE